LARWLFGALAAAEDEDGGDGPAAVRWRQRSALVAAPPTSEATGPVGAVVMGRAGGWRARADAPLQRSHRHHSHLMAVHPLRQAAADPALAGDAEESVRALVLHGHGQWVGFSYVWAASILAHVGQPDAARSLLLDYAHRWVTPASWHVQGSDGRDLSVWNDVADLLGGDAMSLEAGFGFVAAVQDLLLHDHDGCVRLFPAVPSAWPAVAFGGWHAAGGWVVDARLDGGVMVAARIQAERDGLLRLAWPSNGPRPVTLGGEPAAPADGFLEVALSAGQCVAVGSEEVHGTTDHRGDWFRFGLRRR
jgi:hypothetical protein